MDLLNIGDSVTIKNTDSIWDNKEGIIKDIIDKDGKVTYYVYVTFNKEEGKYILQNFAQNKVFLKDGSNYTDEEETLAVDENFRVREDYSNKQLLSNVLNVSEDYLEEYNESDLEYTKIFENKLTEQEYLVIDRRDEKKFLKEALLKEIYAGNLLNILNEISTNKLVSNIFNLTFLKECAKQSLYTYYNNLTESVKLEDARKLHILDECISYNNECLTDDIVSKELERLKTKNDYYNYINLNILRENLKQTIDVDNNSPVYLNGLIDEIYREKSYEKYFPYLKEKIDSNKDFLVYSIK